MKIEFYSAGKQIRFSTFETLMDVVMDMPTIDIEEEDN